MKKKILAFIIIVAVLIVGGITTFGVVKYTSKQDVKDNLKKHSLMEKKPEECAQAIRLLCEEDPKVVYSIGKYSITEGELANAKLLIEQQRMLEGSETLVTDEEATDWLLKRKLMNDEAKENGIDISEERIQKVLNEIRGSNGVTGDGKVADSERLAAFLDKTGLTYEQYEIQTKERIRYTIAEEDYINLIFKQEKEKNPKLEYDDEKLEILKEEHLDILLKELKNNN